MYEIAGFLLDPDRGVFSRDGRTTGLGPRSVAVLSALVRRANHYVAKAEMLEAAWPGAVVEEGNLAVQIATIRRVLAEHGGERWIETLPRRGYRFVGPVAVLREDGSQLGPEAKRTNLPIALTSFIGRERELVEVKRWLPGKRLISIVGVGGIGKTRLALQAAAEAADAYRDGVWLVELGSIRDPVLVPGSVAQALGVQDKGGMPIAESLRTHLRTRQVLLIFDNCEHLLDSCASLIDALLSDRADTTVIATTREPLRIAGEQVYPLHPLSLPDVSAAVDAMRRSEAVQLFVERVQREMPEFELTAGMAIDVAQLCIHLDGIPLALELAAARAPSLSVEQINARLDDRFRLLTRGSRTALPRQQTLRATLDWSYDLLTENERVMFRRIAVFPAAFSVEAAAAVASVDRVDDYAAVDLISQLVSRSLVVADTSVARTRYRLLETVRAYALELAEAGEKDACLLRHARFFREMFEHAVDGWLRMTDPEWRATYVSELANVRAALDWALVNDNAIAVDLAGVSGPLWSTLGLFGEGVQRLETAMGRVEPTTNANIQARLWFWLGRTLSDETPTKAQPALERAVELYRTVGDRVLLGLSLVRLARTVARMGEFTASEAMLAEAGTLLEHAGPRALSNYHSVVGFLKAMTGDPVAAGKHYERALELAREVRDEISILATTGNLANVKWALGDLDAAEKSTRELVDLIRRSPAGTRRLLANALMNLAGLMLQKDDPAASLEPAREALPLVKAEGTAWIHSDYGAERAAREGRFQKAALLAGYADQAHAANHGTRHAVAVRGRSRLDAEFREKLSADQLARLLAEGAKLSDAEAWRLALED